MAAETEDVSVAGEHGEAQALKIQGNEHFKAQRLEEAAACYRKALNLLREKDQAVSSLSQTVRVNLATCLQRSGGLPEEVVSLCDEVLKADPGNAKALFWRADARRSFAQRLPAGSEAEKREALASARQDLVSAARVEPGDRKVRVQLEEVTEELKALGSRGDKGEKDKVAQGFGAGLLYGDKPATAELPPAPQDCETCGWTGHARCGRQFWVEQRAAWLRMPLAEVDREPPTFEDDGTLRAARRAARATAAGEEAAGTAADDSDDPVLSDLGESEREMLEDCLDSTERPYPRLKRPLSLAQAVRCAEELWDDDD